MKRLCPYCNVEVELISKDDNIKVMYFCPKCNNLIATYLKEFHEHLANFFKRYNINTYKPKLPDWVKGD